MGNAFPKGMLVIGSNFLPVKSWNATDKNGGKVERSLRRDYQGMCYGPGDINATFTITIASNAPPEVLVWRDAVRGKLPVPLSCRWPDGGFDTWDGAPTECATKQELEGGMEMTITYAGVGQPDLIS